MNEVFYTQKYPFLVKKEVFLSFMTLIEVFWPKNGRKKVISITPMTEQTSNSKSTVKITLVGFFVTPKKLSKITFLVGGYKNVAYPRSKNPNFWVVLAIF